MCKNKYCFDDTCKGECDSDNRSVCWLGEIPIDMKNKMRYPTEAEIDAALKELDELDES
tara:strand:- start:383 stop:559 length:177 start_codon:yes stop_codon:yes gene_type:complete